MTARELRQKYLEFFKSKGHAIIPSASLVPENDPTVLFTTAGMHPLVPYLMGEKHPAGTRLVDVQKCVRTGDIDEVGDATHHTFFEMLGNWSLGDYFKKESIKMSWEFLTDEKWLGLSKDRIAVSVFAGDDDAPFDEESYNLWKNLGMPESRIARLPKKNNWWGPAGETGPCGADTEIFYWSGDADKVPTSFNDDNDLWVEIWNNVFMEFNKNKDGFYEKMARQNVDTGMGMERILAAMNGFSDNYRTELFLPIIEKIQEISGKKYIFTKGDLGFEKIPDCWAEDMRSMRIIADHIKASVFIIADGVVPSNVQRGYVLRRLIRRAIRYGRLIGIKSSFIVEIAKVVQKIYGEKYQEIKTNEILNILEEEGNKFLDALLKVDDKKNKALRMIKRIKEGKKDEKDEKILNYYSKIAKVSIDDGWNNLEEMSELERKNYVYEKISPAVAFTLQTTDGYPYEMFLEDLKIKFSSAKNYLNKIESEYLQLFKKHQDLSRTASAGMFKGGLADAGEITVKYHTATHLLLAALREILGEETYQKGSNINSERLRFDFNYPEKLTSEQIKQVEDLVNSKIQENLLVEMIEMAKDEALKIAKVSFDPAKYGDVVKVYKIGEFSIELCGGPHVKNISELGKFKITKEEASSAGVRRIKAVLE